MHEPRVHRCVIILRDESNVGEFYATKNSLADSIRAIPEFRGVSVEVESIGRVKVCARCGEVISGTDTLSAKYCDECFQEVQEELEEARIMRKQR